MNAQFAQKLEDRLLRYVRIDTESDETSPTTPSTAKQYDLLKPLVDELNEIGAQDIRLTGYGAVIATVPASTEGDNIPAVAFLGHVDTAPAFSGANVKPIVHRNWDGLPIVLPDDPNQMLSAETIPALDGKAGEDIITASGTTLLGADDKAGVAIVLTMAEHLIANPDIPHGEIRICFTPDEEIGRGVHPDLPADLDVDFAYTLDGGDVGEVVYETFSADKAEVKISGVSIHTGTAKDQLVNAIHLAAKIVDTLPKAVRTPETTDGREGFIHVYKMSGSAAEAELHFILRDFELDGLKAHGALVCQVAEAVAATEPRATITCTISPQYRNMRYWLEDDMRPVDLANEACRQMGIEPFSEPIRGGTDGSRLTELGVLTPNLFTGMHDLHGPKEWISVQDMVISTEFCVRLAELWSGQSRTRKNSPDEK